MNHKVAIYTLNGFTNFGNRLQNYALVKYVDNLGVYCENLWQMKKPEIIKNYIKTIIPTKKYRRIKKFIKFNKYIKTSYRIKDYHFVIVGSDQVWNPNFPIGDTNFIRKKYPKTKFISYSASFGVNEIPAKMKSFYKNELSNYQYLSVREMVGKKIIQELIDNKEVDVLIDPTMLLTINDWNQIIKKPTPMKRIKNKKYILNYFLGEISIEVRKEIERIAIKYECEIINILDKNDPFYISGPSEFLYLEKNAFLVCTDSFHSSVFALLYNKPFIVFDRKDDNNKNGNMNSRIDTLIDKFNLKYRRFNGKTITKENILHDYSEAYKLLEEEREKSKIFLLKALGLKDSDSNE